MHFNDFFRSYLLYLLVNVYVSRPLNDQKKTTNKDINGLESVKEARCGTDPHPKHSRRRRFILHNSLWRKHLLTWRIEKYTHDLPKHTVRKILRRAFRKWSAWTPLTFIEKHHGRVDIKISFEYGNHYPCAYPFDGREGDIAHAYYPYDEQEIAGDIHFDDSEDFTESGYNGKSLPWTALHEIGHSLGLMHSENWGAVMSSEYASFSHPNKPLALTADDINGVQSLYGSPVNGWRTWYFQRSYNHIP